MILLTQDAAAVPQILFQDESILALFKPSGWFVHPPEDPRHRRGLKRKTCVQWLSDTHEIKASPAHRLDAGTEGVLVFGKTKTALQNLNEQFHSKSVQKIYHAVVRGWINPADGKIELPLELDSTSKLVDCLTHYSTLGQIEKDFSPTPKFLKSRYSLLQVTPETGRFHQIRRHMNRISHPIIGDSEHGDIRHNKYFRETLGLEGLCLKALKISLSHPVSNTALTFESLLTPKWEMIYKNFNHSPVLT